MSNINKIEIMSPVGSFESLMAAIQAKADSVYFGIGKLNMRSHSAINFTVNNLEEIIEICNNNNVKSYLTLNTIIYDNEIEEMQNMVSIAKKKGISAIIASDMAVLDYGKKLGVEMHASTQLNITNIESLKFFANYCDVIVLARELSILQQKYICKKVNELDLRGPKGNLIKIEAFVHGALCMAVSGKCYLSLHHHNKSANRGQCFQHCRRAYTVKEKESGYELEIDNEYIMSPKDLCTISFLDKIIDAGISVLKIEGRARSAEYVKTVTKCYKEAAEAVFLNTYSQEKIDTWTKELNAVFNRGFWDGYYMGKSSGEWSEQYGSAATRRKEYIGKVTNYFSNIEVVEVLMESGNLNHNDEILIIGPTSGVVETIIKRLDDSSGEISSAVKGIKCSFKIAEKVRRNDKVYKWINKE